MKSKLLIIVFCLISLLSCQKDNVEYRYYIEWDSWKTGLHSCVLYGSKDAIPTQVLINDGPINEYRLLFDGNIIDSFTTRYPNHVRHGEAPFYIKNFYKVD